MIHQCQSSLGLGCPARRGPDETNAGRGLYGEVESNLHGSLVLHHMVSVEFLHCEGIVTLLLTQTYTPGPEDDEWRTSTCGRCAQRTFLHQAEIRSFEYKATEYTLSPSVDIRTDGSRETLQFLAAFTKLVLDHGHEFMGLDRDDEFARMRDLWIDASEDVLLDDQVGREYWMSDKWLECAGTKYEFGVTIRVLIDEGESDAEEYTFVSVSPPSANAKVIKATCHAFWTGTARDSYETYHFDMKTSCQPSSVSVLLRPPSTAICN